MFSAAPTFCLSCSSQSRKFSRCRERSSVIFAPDGPKWG
jgi:hypothetical protein